MIPIDLLEVSTYEIPTQEPYEADGTLEWSSTTVVVVTLGAGGKKGLGFSYATTACETLIKDVLAKAILGCDVLDTGAIWAKMVKSIRNLGRPGISSMSISAVDIAAWDLKAHLVGLPLADLIGKCRNKVEIYGSGGFTSLSDDQLTKQLDGWVYKQKIPRVKIKVGSNWGKLWQRDIQRVELAREYIGNDTELFVDANGAYSRKQALRMAQEFERYGVSWFEEPVSSDDLSGLRQIKESTTADVTAGEYGYSLVYFSNMANSGAVDCLQIDISRCGGITEWMRISAVAAAIGLEVSAHCAPSLHLHPACATQNIRHIEYFADHVRIENMLFDGVAQPKPGGVLSPFFESIGMGLELKAEAEKFRKDFHG